jgi:hypothetical protein
MNNPKSSLNRQAVLVGSWTGDDSQEKLKTVGISRLLSLLKEDAQRSTQNRLELIPPATAEERYHQLIAYYTFSFAQRYDARNFNGLNQEVEAALKEISEICPEFGDPRVARDYVESLFPKDTPPENERIDLSFISRLKKWGRSLLPFKLGKDNREPKNEEKPPGNEKIPNRDTIIENAIEKVLGSKVAPYYDGQLANIDAARSLLEVFGAKIAGIPVVGMCIRSRQNCPNNTIVSRREVFRGMARDGTPIFVEDTLTRSDYLADLLILTLHKLGAVSKDLHGSSGHTPQDLLTFEIPGISHLSRKIAELVYHENTYSIQQTFSQSGSSSLKAPIAALLRRSLASKSGSYNLPEPQKIIAKLAEMIEFQAEKTAIEILKKLDGNNEGGRVKKLVEDLTTERNRGGEVETLGFEIIGTKLDQMLRSFEKEIGEARAIYRQFHDDPLRLSPASAASGNDGGERIAYNHRGLDPEEHYSLL